MLDGWYASVMGSHTNGRSPAGAARGGGGGGGGSGWFGASRRGGVLGGGFGWGGVGPVGVCVGVIGLFDMGLFVDDSGVIVALASLVGDPERGEAQSAHRRARIESVHAFAGDQSATGAGVAGGPPIVPALIQRLVTAARCAMRLTSGACAGSGCEHERLDMRGGGGGGGLGS